MDLLQQLEEDGFCLLESVFDTSEVKGILAEIESGLKAADQGSIKSSFGETYAARNIAQFNSKIRQCWVKPRLTEFLHAVLGAEAGLVRVLYFDKHPNRTWSLPWHKDMTIAVKDNQLGSSHFSKPTTKAGVPHVEGSEEVLANMLTLRVRLDDVTPDNGPLQVARGSHHNGKEPVANNDVTTVYSQAGDVFAMRPLVTHASGSSTEGCESHRRILHLEFAGQSLLPDGYEWHRYEKVAGLST